MNKLLCYELNEVPWRVVDLYLAKRPNSELAKLLKRSAQFTTHCNDGGELHPWSTWPTLHRGVSNEVHNIHYLNQDLSPTKAWPPIWEILNNNNVSTGIFGSLQSYPPVNHKHMLFHVPDTFAAGSETVPAKFEPFQAFNLQQTGENKAAAASVSASNIPDVLGLFRAGIKPTTLGRVAKHLVNERLNALHKTRRSLLQPELAIDAFLSGIKEQQPQYVTFFSNHVAGVMHRYWKYSFPEDFDDTDMSSERSQFHANSLIQAMDQFDAHLGKIIPFAKKHNYNIVVLSSMGQEAIDRGEYIDELMLDDLNALLTQLGCDYPVRMNLAMQPDIAFEFDAAEHLENFREKLNAITDSDGKKILIQRYDSVGTTLNIAAQSSESLAKNRSVKYLDKTFTVTDFGLELINRDQGTAYHQPEGILIWEGFESALAPRSVIDSRSIAPTLIQHFGIEPGDYMQPPVASAR